jgi:glycosyltransferase involved in cell wall biosynthesis
MTPQFDTNHTTNKTLITVGDLPPPPPGKKGWPWTFGCRHGRINHNNEGPHITIAIPSFNQGEYIEATIRSILLQGYEELSLIVFDGGSSDNTVSILRRYHNHIAHWESCADNGQAHAINKALSQARGGIFQFINSDDILAPYALECIASNWNENCVAGSVINFGECIPTTITQQSLNSLSLTWLLVSGHSASYHQPGIWLSTDNLRDMGGFREDLRYAFDLEMYIRYFYYFKSIRYVPDVLALFRKHCESKTVREAKCFNDEFRLVRNLHAASHPSFWVRLAALIALDRYTWNHDIQRIIEQNHTSRAKIIFKILRGISERPVSRLDRFTLGSIKRIATRVPQ